MYPRSAALLPVGDRVNPLNPDKDYWLYEPGMTAYVVVKMSGYSTERESVSDAGRRTLRVLTSHGFGDDSWAIGTVHEIHHDQTCARLGNFKVAGIARWTADGVVAEGEVPDRRIAHWVFK